MDSAPKPTKVLVVEDEESFLEALRIGLGREGFAIDVARDGVEALARFDAGDPDIVLLDVMLPRISGIDVCREIRRKSDVPIIMVSAKGEEIDAVVGLEVGDALDRGTSDADLHIVIDLEPETIRPVLAGNRAEDAGSSYHVLAYLDGFLEILLITHPLPLRADHQEVHGNENQRQKQERKNRTTAGVGIGKNGCCES